MGPLRFRPASGRSASSNMPLSRLHSLRPLGTTTENVDFQEAFLTLRRMFAQYRALYKLTAAGSHHNISAPLALPGKGKPRALEYYGFEILRVEGAILHLDGWACVPAWPGATTQAALVSEGGTRVAVPLHRYHRADIARTLAHRPEFATTDPVRSLAFSGVRGRVDISWIRGTEHATNLTLCLSQGLQVACARLTIPSLT